MRLRTVTLAALMIAGSSSIALLALGQDPAPADVATMQRKLGEVIARGLVPAAAGTEARTPFTEREVNAYLKFSAVTQLPTGVVDPQVVIADGGHLEGRAMVDLDLVRKSKVRSALDPANLLLHGSVEVRAAGALAATAGKGKFDLTSASVGGVPVPKSVLQMIVGYYTRSADLPDGVSLDQPFDLPIGIRAVETRRGTAIIVQ